MSVQTYPLFSSMRFRIFIQMCIVLTFVLGNFLNLRSGWADNGDYTRIMTWVTSGPAHMEENWPDSESPLRKQRFFYFWVPDWKLDLPMTSKMFSSSLLLWLPGILLNRYFYSAYTLSAPIMSLGARVMLLGLLLLVFLWIDKRSRLPIFHYLTIALPLALLFSTSDLVAFFNTFYQENGAIVFIPYLLAIVISGHFLKRNWQFYTLYFLTALLVTTSKPSCFYWSVISLPFVISFSQVPKKPLVWVPIGVALAIIPLLLGVTLPNEPSNGIREYNSLFTGTLLLSEHPDAQLAMLGMPDAIHCIGKDGYGTEEGRDCYNQLKEKLTYRGTLQTMAFEPGIFGRQIWLLSQTFQNYSLHLGKYAFTDATVYQKNRMNFWSAIKKAYFPRGWLLIGLIPIFCLLISMGWNRKGITGDLAYISPLCLVAFILDPIIQIWGDGQRDLLKHLFIPNMVFDLLLIFCLNIAFALLYIAISKWVSRRTKLSFE